VTWPEPELAPGAVVPERPPLDPELRDPELDEPELAEPDPDDPEFDVPDVPDAEVPDSACAEADVVSAAAGRDTATPAAPSTLARPAAAVSLRSRERLRSRRLMAARVSLLAASAPGPGVMAHPSDAGSRSPACPTGFCVRSQRADDIRRVGGPEVPGRPGGARARWRAREEPRWRGARVRAFDPVIPGRCGRVCVQRSGKQPCTGDKQQMSCGRLKNLELLTEKPCARRSIGSRNLSPLKTGSAPGETPGTREGPGDRL